MRSDGGATVAAGSRRFRPTNIQYLNTLSNTTGICARKSIQENFRKRDHSQEGLSCSDRESRHQRQRADLGWCSEAAHLNFRSLLCASLGRGGRCTVATNKWLASSCRPPATHHWNCYKTHMHAGNRPRQQPVQSIDYCIVWQLHFPAVTNSPRDDAQLAIQAWQLRTLGSTP